MANAAFWGLRLVGLPDSARPATAIVFAIAMDVLLTFATPALTYSVRSVFDALRMGRLILQRSWRDVAWYALAPGLTWLAVASAAWPLGDGPVLAILMFGSALSLACKGAAARWYLGAYPDTERDGAAYRDAPRFEAARRRAEPRAAG